MKIAVFGGSFDPLHVGHIQIINEALNSLHIDKLFIVPTYLNPFKKKSFASSSLRLNWLQKVFTCKDKLEILNYEIEQERSVPTIETIQYLKKKYANIQKIYLIIGADNLATLHKWYKYEELSKLVQFVVASRDNKIIPENLIKLAINAKISSSNLRENMNSSFIPQIIEDEIKRHYKMKQRIENIVNILDNKKAENIQIFDMSDKDYFVEQVVLATTMGERHGISLLDDLKKGLKDKNESFLQIDDENEWIVIDLGDILIHLMSPQYRSKYNIEEFLSERDAEMKKLQFEAGEE
ncbi:nicotinate (nicotinamide) nucleotide adenylyltransferase [Sulfurospirillum arcachonense]|uniref:nicotinate (nicotinamide) nucleotide adenylyltransferase n=1 Tax=Sulfurospirillum arcachonense TaxID=57666 RepID=UPI000468DA98|nr:nicotinate (nicotinamide) nucleotide adenylyltransferase [Sulfurospirillum arcachonense]